MDAIVRDVSAPDRQMNAAGRQMSAAKDGLKIAQPFMAG